MLWHAYPVIGIDDRNQWDFYDVPGLPEAVAALHDAGVRVFVDYNPWDTGTRRGGPDADELAEVIRDLGVDGVFLDTLKKGEPELLARLDAARPGVAVEGESKLPLARIADHPLAGRSGSPTRRCPACCARTCSSDGTCSTTSAAGTATTPAS